MTEALPLLGWLALGLVGTPLIYAASILLGMGVASTGRVATATATVIIGWFTAAAWGLLCLGNVIVIAVNP